MNNTAEILALQQTVVLLLHLLPDDRKQIAYTAIEHIKNEDYESLMLQTNPNLPIEQAKEQADKISNAYSSVLKSASNFDKKLNF